MPRIDTIVIGASAGGVEALSCLVAGLPKDFAAAVFVVVHFPQSSTSVLPAILERSGPLPATHAEDGETVVPGRIYVAPPGRHLLLHGDTVHTVNGPKENGNRPAIDPLFRSAAHARRNRVVGVLLTGLLDDGTMGQWALRRQAGYAICQDPEDAMFPDMPRSAIAYGACDRILPLDAIAPALVDLVGREVPDLPGETMTDPVEMPISDLTRLESRGQPSAFVCPECQGTLFELAEEGVTHYRCRVGHSYLPESLAADQEGILEVALWTALRALEEHNDLLQRMIVRSDERHMTIAAKSYRSKLAQGVQRLDLLRHVLGLPRTDALVHRADAA